jgi:mono/diheme cytochrome c family protein
VKSLLGNRRPETTLSRGRGRVERSLRLTRVVGAVYLLALAAIAGVLLLGRWDALAQPTKPAAQGPATVAGNIENGTKVFADEKCAACHGSQGEGGAGAIAGPRIGPPRFALAMFIDAVRNPKDPMPAFSSSQVSDTQLADVYAFLKSMAPAAQAATAAPAGNAENGKRLFLGAGCYQCHDREGQGGNGTGPRLAPNPIAFAAFIHQCRQPAAEMPPYTAKVISDADLADIYAFLQSIPKPPAASGIPLLQ